MNVNANNFGQVYRYLELISENIMKFREENNKNV